MTLVAWPQERGRRGSDGLEGRIPDKFILNRMGCFGYSWSQRHIVSLPNF